MPYRQTLAVWLAYIILSSCRCALPAVSRPLKHSYSGMLHSFFHQPFQNAEKQQGIPEHVYLRQQQMLEALHRHKHHDLHIIMQEKQQQQHHHQQQQPAAPFKTAAAGGSAASLLGTAAVRASNMTESQLLHELNTKWPDGYAAVCAVVKDQNRDLRYWVEYHRWIGINKFYIFDNNSTMPALMVLWDYIQQGIVDYQYFVGKPRKKPEFSDTNQYRAYQGCLLQHFKQHRWLAFIDIDEFFVLPPAPLTASTDWTEQAGQGSLAAAAAQGKRDSQNEPQVPPSAPAPLEFDIATPDALASSSNHLAGNQPLTDSSGWQNKRPNLPILLAQYEQYAAIGINWVMFGSSGLQQRPPAGPLASYTSCVPQEHWESSHVKVIANTGGILGVGPTPHEVVPRPGRSTVDVDGQPFKGPKSPQTKWHKLVLHHYVLKSKEEFASKKARGSGAGNIKEWSFFNYMDNLSNSTCNWGSSISRAFFASKPRLRPVRAGHPCSVRSKQIAAQQQLAAAAAAVAAAEAATDGMQVKDGRSASGTSVEHGDSLAWQAASEIFAEQE